MGQVCSQELANVLPDGPYLGAKNTRMQPVITDEHMNLQPLRTIDTPAQILSQSVILDEGMLHTDLKNVPRQTLHVPRQLVVSRIEQPITPAPPRKKYDQVFYELLLESGTLTEFVYQNDDQNLSNGCEYRQAQLAPDEQYMGEWKNNRPHGKGVLTTPYQKYLGWFKDGRKHQYGREISHDEVYEGQFNMGNRSGEGRRFTPLRSEIGRYDVELVRGRIKYLDNQSSYEGDLVNGLRHSRQGVFVWSDFTTYVGSFQNDMISGKGRMTYSDGRTYTGDFVNEVKHGKGVFVWPADAHSQERSYTGEYFNNQRQGKGLYVWKWRNLEPGTNQQLGGDTREYYYQGEFWNDLPHGHGTIQDEKGKRRAEFVYGREITDFE